MTSRWMTFAAGLVLNAAFAGAGLAADVTAPIKDGNGDTIGEVQVTGAPHGVLLRVSAKRLTPGWHGIHLHAKGDCGDAQFKNAGGHIVHGGKMPHGLLNPDGHDSGDLPNLYADADGNAHAEFYSDFVRLKKAEGDHPALLDDDGSAVVIHEHADDFKTQPIGGAGARVGCAVIH
jgi:Cu-Zn family superoxide dismutase